MVKEGGKIFFSFIFGGILFLSLFKPFQAQAVGITPGELFFENVVANSVINTSVYFTRSNASATDHVKIIIEGTAAPYISLPLGNEMDLPVDSLNTEFPLQINAGSLASGTYSAYLTVAPQSKNLGGGGGEEGVATAGTTFLAGAKSSVTFTVTNEALESFSIQSVSVGDAEQGQPVGFSYLLNNSGNVDTRPGKIEFSVTDELDPSNTYTETFLADVIPLVPAFSTQSTTLETQADLTPGLYATQIVFYDSKGTVIFTSDNIRLQMFPAGTLAQKGQIVSFGTDKKKYEQGELVIFTSTFQNIGEIGVEAELVIEVFQGDKRIEVLKNEGQFIPAGQKVELDYTYTPPSGGQYSAKSYVVYGIYKTEEIETTFSVQTLNMLYVIGFLVLLTLLIGLVLFWIHRRKQKKKNSNLTSQPAQTENVQYHYPEDDQKNTNILPKQ